VTERLLTAAGAELLAMAPATVIDWAAAIAKDSADALRSLDDLDQEQEHAA
jgi:hypothetical protein